MPFMSNKICKCCGVEQAIEDFRFKRETKRPLGFYLSTCKACEKEKYQEYQQKNKAYFRLANKKSYLKKVGIYKRILNRSDADKAQRARDKSNRRCTRAKQARRYDELTLFVYKEAHELRKLRNKLTGFDWQVDHIIPLINPIVCGLHVWNNFAVIPKVDNLRKGNYYPVHD